MMLNHLLVPNDEFHCHVSMNLYHVLHDTMMLNHRVLDVYHFLVVVLLMTHNMNHQILYCDELVEVNVHVLYDVYLKFQYQVEPIYVLGFFYLFHFHLLNHCLNQHFLVFHYLLFQVLYASFHVLELLELEFYLFLALQRQYCYYHF